jgi:hypothetical protein
MKLEAGFLFSLPILSHSQDLLLRGNRFCRPGAQTFWPKIAFDRAETVTIFISILKARISRSWVQSLCSDLMGVLSAWINYAYVEVANFALSCEEIT